MKPEQIRVIREAFAQAALTGLLSGVTLSDNDEVRAAQLRRISAEAVEIADITIARLNRTAIYPVEINPKDETAIHNARTG